jgi:uncharacterized repeat protein (TIGR01451 family)
MDNGDLFNYSPSLAPLGFYGGPVETMPLLPGSVGIDAGTTAADSQIASAEDVPVADITDARGLPRVVGNSIDIGATEYQYDLALTGSAPTSVNATNGASISYSLTVTNVGFDPAAGATLTDVLPAGTVFESASVPSGWTIQSPAVGQGGTVTITTTSTLASDASATFTIVVQLPAFPLGVTSIVNNPTLQQGTWDTDATDKSLTLTTAITVSPVDISSDVNTSIGGLRYDFTHKAFVQTVTLTNVGQTNLAGPIVLELDGLPSGVSLQGASGSDNGNPYLMIVPENGTWAVGQTLTLTLMFTDPSFTAINDQLRELETQ